MLAQQIFFSTESNHHDRCPRTTSLNTSNAHLRAIVQGVGIFETLDDGASWSPRNHGLRADWPRPDPEVGFCVHKLVVSPCDPDRLYQQNHCGIFRIDRPAVRWTEIGATMPKSVGSIGFPMTLHPRDPVGKLARSAHTPTRRWQGHADRYASMAMHSRAGSGNQTTYTRSWLWKNVPLTR